ncbi:type II secretion system F family protein [Castellaniella sp.]|uniref:type II secretion system F family protein n=1 Tax=Castellaniella sp. TaxID=1955812 RepID=UPI003561DD6E
MWWLMWLPAGLCLAIGAWLLMNQAERRWQAYRQRVDEETRHTLDASFLFIDPRRVWLAFMGLLAVLAVVFAWVVGRWWGVWPVFVALAILPRLILQQFGRRRVERFDAQLPHMILALAGALRAGSGLQPALQHLAAQSPVPLSQELGLMLRQQRLGMSLESSLDALRTRMPTESCALFVSAVGIALRTGGNLADTLESMATTLRMRQHWIGRVRALTAQGRLQSHIMLGLPVLLVIVLARLEPDAMSLLWTTWYGWFVLSALIVLDLIGMFWIRRITRIDI